MFDVLVLKTMLYTHPTSSVEQAWVRPGDKLQDEFQYMSEFSDQDFQGSGRRHGAGTVDQAFLGSIGGMALAL